MTEKAKIREYGPNVQRCGATRKYDGQPCRQPVEPGRNRCRWHGGKTPKGKDTVNMKTGRYSVEIPRRLYASFEAARADEKALTLRDEISLLDTRLSELVGGLDSGLADAPWDRLLLVMEAVDMALESGDMTEIEKSVKMLRQAVRNGKSYDDRWRNIIYSVQHRRVLVESERERIVQMSQVMTARQVMVLVGALVDVLNESVAVVIPGEDGAPVRAQIMDRAAAGVAKLISAK
jgi:hypothetical protein